MVLFFLFVASAIGCFFVADRFWFAHDKTSNLEEQSLREYVSGTLPVSAMIVPHHLMAEKAIDETFSVVAKEDASMRIYRVILLSPNHFNRGRGWLASTKREWKTNAGIVRADDEAIDLLGSEVFVRDDVLDLEHGVYNIVPFVAKYFPQARVVPIAIRDGTPRRVMEALTEKLSGKKENTLVILSADFSHYLDKNLSLFHDEKALQTIRNFSYDDAGSLDIDCPTGLYAVMRYAQQEEGKNFHLVRRSSSSTIIGENKIGEETSHIAGYFSKKDDGVKRGNAAFFLFAGDGMLDRDVRGIMSRRGALWSTRDIARIFLAQDMNMLNLEGPVTKNTSVSSGTTSENPNHFRFTFDSEKTRAFLLGNRFNAVNLGNNHAGNFGKEGAQETRNFLQENGVGFFGDPFDVGNTVYETSVRGQKIALVNYNAFSSISAEQTIDTVRKEGTLGYKVFVYCHWGVEYALRENEKQRALAHAFIDAGADAVIGSHPHVVEPIEAYKGKTIFYSLGNFVFDQYFSDDTREGLLLGVEAGDEGMKFILVPIWTEKDGRVRLSADPYRKKLLERIAGDSTVEESIRLGIQGGYFSIK